MPVYKKGPTTPSEKVPLKRSQTEDPKMFKKHASMDDRRMQLISSSKKIGKLYDQQIQVEEIHGKNMINVRKGADADNNREDYLDRNMGYSVQRKLEVMDELDSQKKYQHKNKKKQAREI